ARAAHRRGLAGVGPTSSSRARPMTPSRRALAAGVGGALALGVIGLLALFVGAADVPVSDVVAAFFGQPTSPLTATVVLQLRLPRVLLAALAGAGLAVAGAGFQALTRNPLADPALLGVAGGAAFGAVVGQIAGLEGTVLATLGLSALAFAGALVAAVAVYAIAAVGGRLPIQSLLLA